MSDPILISQIIQSEGLTGKNAELRRAELEKKPNGELQTLLSSTNSRISFDGNLYGDMGWKPTAKEKPKYTPAQSEAMEFMGEMLKNASEIMNAQAKKDNRIGDGVNFVKETFNTEYAKSNVEASIDSTINDYNKLEDAARKVPSEFETTFQQLRGVKFDEKKIKDCTQKAKDMAEFQSATDTIDALKSQLSSALVNTSSNNISQSGEKAILKTLSTMGYKKIGEVIQAAMKGHENDPAVKNYMKEGGRFAVRKNSKGETGIYRETEQGGWQPITQEQAQIIGKEIELRLNKLHSGILGVEIPEKATSEEIAKLNESKLEKYRADYEKSFAQAYGKKDLKQLSQNYMMSQEQGQAYVQMGVNILAMAGAMFSGGGTLALVSTGVMLTNPVGFIQMATDADGMTAKDWKAYGEGALEQAGWMALGMGAGKVGDLTRSFVKVKGLSKVIKESGKSFDDFLKIAAKSPDIPSNIAKSLKTVSRLANTAGVTTEVAADMATTIALQKDGATNMDWAMSIGGALVGTKMQKVLAPMSKDAKVKHIMETFKDFKIDEKEANHLLKAMADAESGAAPVKKTDETHIVIPKGKFAAPNAKFAESDDAFKSIVHNRAADIKKINEIDNIDEFCQKSFDLLKEEMGIEDSNMELVITDNDNHYDLMENKVYISRNWAGHKTKNASGKGDKAEIFGGMAHELNHYLQWKEVILNLDTENPYWGALVETLQGSERASDNIGYLLEKYPDNTELKECFDKAKTYENNWKNYIDAFDENGNLKTGKDYGAYKNQIVEEESFRRGDIVVDAYRDITRATVAKTSSPATISGGGATTSRSLETPDSKVSSVVETITPTREAEHAIKKNNIESDKKDFLKKTLSVTDKKGNGVISEFTAQKLMEVYGEENVPKLTKLLDEIKTKYNDDEFAAKLFTAYTTNQTTVKSKDFDFVKKFMDGFQDTVENRQELMDLVVFMNIHQKEAAQILLDLPKRELYSGESWNDLKRLTSNLNDFKDSNSVKALKRACSLRYENGICSYRVDDLKKIINQKDFLISDNYTDKELLNLKNGLFEITGNSKVEHVAKILNAKENEDLRLELKSVLNIDGIGPLVTGLRKLQPKIKEKTIPFVLNEIQDKTLKSLVKRNLDKIDNPAEQLKFVEIMAKQAENFSQISDKKILSKIAKNISEIAENVNNKKEAERLIIENFNLYNTDLGLHGKDTYIFGNAKEYLQKMEKIDSEKAKVFKNAVKQYEKLPEGEYYLFVKGSKLASEYGHEFVDSIINYSNDRKIESMKKYYSDIYKNKSSMTGKQKAFADNLYKEKYLSMLPEETAALCEKIHDSFGVKMFLSENNETYSLNLVYNELLEWQKASRGEAIMPPVLDLSLIKADFVNSTTVGNCTLATKNINIRGSYQGRILYALRHETAHANDSKVEINSGILNISDGKGSVKESINIDDIIIHKQVDGKMVPDLERCKYVKEFKKAGLSDFEIEYAYTNKAEFVAIATAGDYSKYSPEFKDLLVKLGLPKWVFKMKNKNDISPLDNLYVNEKFSDRYTLWQNQSISRNSEALYNMVAQNKNAVENDFREIFSLPDTKMQMRVKDLQGINEKIYRELDRIDDKIADVSDIEAYNAKKLKKGDEPLTQEMADALIEKYNIDKENLINNYDNVYNTLQDTFGARLVMDDTSPSAVEKVLKSILEGIDSGKFKLIEINNYQGAGSIPYFSSAQVKQIQAHCSRKGYELKVISDVNAPQGKKAQYKNAFNSEKAVKTSGYTTFQMNIEHANGVISEFQIRGKEINELAESEHIFYDISQKKDLSKGNKQLKMITDPLVEVVENMNLPGNETVKKAYSQYLTDCYKYARMKELGIAAVQPKLPENVHPMLNIGNIINIHNMMEDLKSK